MLLSEHMQREDRLFQISAGQQDAADILEERTEISPLSPSFNFLIQVAESLGKCHYAHVK